MVIGHGMLAQAFVAYKDNLEFVIFSSGVSNSKEMDDAQYHREENLLKDVIKKYSGKTLIYFSTLSVYDEENNYPYIKHKLKMEALIKNQVHSFYIFRLPEIVGHSKNKNTIVNFLFYHIKNDKIFEVWNRSCRRLLDVDDMVMMITKIIKNNVYINQIINISVDKATKIKQLVFLFENILKKKSKNIIVEKGNCYHIDDINYMTVEFNSNKEYNETLIKKYFL
jgi:nucleoside-diphosphate-sugar epimerase